MFPLQLISLTTKNTKNIMTRKHFNTIANNLRQALENDPNAHNAIVFLARNLANEFELFNPNFNRDYFLAVALGETE